jgi:hypothetical protein
MKALFVLTVCSLFLTSYAEAQDRADDFGRGLFAGFSLLADPLTTNPSNPETTDFVVINNWVLLVKHELTAASEFGYFNSTYSAHSLERTIEPLMNPKENIEKGELESRAKFNSTAESLRRLSAEHPLSEIVESQSEEEYGFLAGLEVALGSFEFPAQELPIELKVLFVKFKIEAINSTSRSLRSLVGRFERPALKELIGNLVFLLEAEPLPSEMTEAEIDVRLAHLDNILRNSIRMVQNLNPNHAALLVNAKMAAMPTASSDIRVKACAAAITADTPTMGGRH